MNSTRLINLILVLLFAAILFLVCALGLEAQGRRPPKPGYEPARPAITATVTRTSRYVRPTPTPRYSRYVRPTATPNWRRQ